MVGGRVFYWSSDIINPIINGFEADFKAGRKIVMKRNEETKNFIC